VVLTTYGTVVQNFKAHNKQVLASSSPTPDAAGKAEKKDASKDGEKRKQAVGVDSTSTGLHTVAWQRVVLDEAHVIRNRTAQSHKACVAPGLRGKRELRVWTLTGTRLVNTVNDLQSLCVFLKATPLMDFQVCLWTVCVLMRL
jgi:SNF2 family DNA or RNA helicase